MPIQPSASTLSLPRGWPAVVKSAILHVIGLAQFCVAYTRSWASNSCNERIRLKAELDRARQELSLLRETLRIYRLRMEQIPTHRRPHYQPTQRLALLQLKAARNWSLERTALEFLVTADTIRSWLQRVDEHGPDALVQMPTSVSFKGALQTLEASQPLSDFQGHRGKSFHATLYEQLLDSISLHRVADHPDRFEPRKRKSKPLRFEKMTKPRWELKREMLQRDSKN